MIADPVTATRLRSVFPDLAKRWRSVCDQLWKEHAVQIRVSDGFRSFAEQLKCYSQGRKKIADGSWIVTDLSKVVTYAMPGESFHNFGLALDSCFHGDDPYLSNDPQGEILWEEFGKACQKQSLTWGGLWEGKKKDRPHCEISYGLSIHNLYIINERDGLQAVWDRCRKIALCGGELI